MAKKWGVSMRLKEIKPGMNIKCETYDEYRFLLEELDRLGYSFSPHNYFGEQPGQLGSFFDRIYAIHEGFLVSHSSAHYCKVTHTFKDLIIKDELTNEEVIELLREKYTKTYANIASRRCYTYQALDDKVMKLKPSEIIAELVEYKKQKEIKVVSKEEYSKVASDKLDELYPKGWKVEE